MSFKDLFSTQATDYAKFRPTYPKDLYSYLSGLAHGRDLAWDCATGNGQAAVELAGYFKKVIATDPSEKQLAAAVRKPNIEYRIGTAEQSGLEDNSIQLTTVAQAFHWFKHEEFFKELRRVSVDSAILAVYGYSTMKTTEALRPLTRKLHFEILDGYWEKERKIVDEGFRGVEVPFEELKTPEFKMTSDWNFDQLMGYFGTWSALQTYIKRNNHNPLDDMIPEFRKAWGDQETIHIEWKFDLRVFRVR